MQLPKLRGGSNLFHFLKNVVSMAHEILITSLLKHGGSTSYKPKAILIFKISASESVCSSDKTRIRFSWEVREA